MFNAPRPTHRYGAASTPNGFGNSFVDDNPLASSMYDSVDPWSAAPSPAPTPMPPASSVFSSVIAEATVPAIYNSAFSAVNPSNSVETSVGSLSRVLATSGLPAATVERIVNLVSNRPRVSKLEFFVALALVALAQAGKDVSVEQVAALSSQNTLPEPALDLESLTTSVSTFAPSNIRQSTAPARASIPSYADDPWNTGSRGLGSTLPPTPGEINGEPPRNGGLSSLAGTGLPVEWWKKQQTVAVAILGQHGFILNRYTLYQVTSELGVVSRRYSEFVYLWDVLTRRYPFRLFPALPPKRVGPDEQFLEQRRRGLQRCLNFIRNHPIIKEDAVLSTFLTVPSLEDWRKVTSVTLDEESAGKHIDKVEEMAIPSDLEDKIATVRARVTPLIDQWQRICMLSERMIKRREAAAVRDASFRRQLLPTHPALLSLSSSAPSSPISSNASIHSMANSIHSIMDVLHLPHTPHPPDATDNQGDLARLTNTVRTVVEVNEHCWRGDECELSNGVRAGMEQVAAHFQRHTELSELRTRVLLDTTLEALRSQRDLFVAVRELFIRHDRLSIDQVERLKRRVETTSLKMEGVRAQQKDGWEEEADRLASQVEKDQATITSQLNRRVFIRACLWHELRVVLHNRENTLLSVLLHAFTKEEMEFAEAVLSNWSSLSEGVAGMPTE
ncbi:hypothetical protein CYLTODRAFT_359731 [Cylindrobasidium torrendii FP15055 ss-10]|uniref:Sorting nexin MVP1 n=1 Tax=Cylindrobasidium torrendii FP15055 ss-10 TaxID=1314674 RepID=A0A0D7AYY5_9AGAR|nr:hypothetical protein CYLTODRAFT_359731 [Cylindrobasidium torrendii FP15055 ss-10]